MRFANHVQGLLAILMVAPVAGQAVPKPAEELAQLTRDLRTAIEVLEAGLKPGMTEAEKKAVTDRHSKQVGALARRALKLAETYPDAPEAPRSADLDSLQSRRLL